MIEYVEHLTTRFEAEEKACEILTRKAETAMTGIGRRIAELRLSLHQAELGRITDEYDIAELYQRPTLQPQVGLEAMAETTVSCRS